MRNAPLACVLAFFCFLCLPACALQYPDELWAPEKPPHWYGENDEMYNIVRWCNQGHYTGFSKANLQPLMTEMCNALTEGNKICAFELTDENTTIGQTLVWNDSKKEYDLEMIEETDHKFYLINLYIDKNGIVYDCKGAEGTLRLLPKSKKKDVKR